MRSKKEIILITGVAGLIGSRYAKFILDNYGHKYEVVGIDDLSGGRIENIPIGVKFIKADLTSSNTSTIEWYVKTYIGKRKLDYICHFAAYAAEGLSPFIRTFNYNNNLIATSRLINIAIKHDVKRFLFTSSMAVYGSQPHELPYYEDLQPKPIDPYGIAKYACEMDLQCAYDQHNLKFTIIRPHNVFGDNQNIWDKYRNVLGIWMYQKLNNLPLTIYGDGEQTRAFTYIDNILQPLYNAMILDTTIGEIINLGGMFETRLNTIATMLNNEVFETSSTIEYLEPRHEAKYAYPTYQKSIDLLDYKEETSLIDGLKSMWEWAKKQPNLKRMEWDEFEINKNIYSYWKIEK